MGAPRKQGDCGHGVPRRQWSGGSGRWQAVRGAPVEAKEAKYGVVWARGRVEEGAPRRARAPRQQWRRQFWARACRVPARPQIGARGRGGGAGEVGQLGQAGSGLGLAGGKGVAGSAPWLVVAAVSPSGRRDATCSTTSGQRRSRRGGSSDAVAWPGGEAAAGAASLGGAAAQLPCSAFECRE